MQRQAAACLRPWLFRPFVRPSVVRSFVQDVGRKGCWHMYQSQRLITRNPKRCKYATASIDKKSAFFLLPACATCNLDETFKLAQASSVGQRGFSDLEDPRSTWHPNPTVRHTSKDVATSTNQVPGRAHQVRIRMRTGTRICQFSGKFASTLTVELCILSVT